MLGPLEFFTSSLGNQLSLVVHVYYLLCVRTHTIQLTVDIIHVIIVDIYWIYLKVYVVLNIQFSILTATLLSGEYYYSHFISKETEAPSLES